MKKIIVSTALFFVLVHFLPAQNSASVPGDFVLVEGGTFSMGASEIDEIDEDDYYERPCHRVKVSSFYMCKHEVTQKEWNELMDENYTETKGDDLPVFCDWFDAVEYCNKRSVKEGLTPCYIGDRNSGYKCDFYANGYRLPTEAEWEFAARGGNKSKDYIYSGSDRIEEVAWCEKNSQGKIHSVMTKKPNELGIYDMTGNVSEYCWDWYGEYSESSQKDPRGAASGTHRINRGGSYESAVNWGTVYSRSALRPDQCFDDGEGFRLVRSVPQVLTPKTKPTVYNYVYPLEGLRLRDAPHGKKIGLLKTGERVEVLDKTDYEELIDGLKYPWTKVRTMDGKEGYVFDGYLSDSLRGAERGRIRLWLFDVAAWIDEWENYFKTERNPAYNIENDYRLILSYKDDDMMTEVFDGVEFKFYPTYNEKTRKHGWFLNSVEIFANGKDFPECLPFKLGDSIDAVEKIYGKPNGSTNADGECPYEWLTSPHTTEMYIKYSEYDGIYNVRIEKTGW